MFVHGYAEHMGRYESLIQELLEAGYSAVAYDQRGHGTSQGHRCLLPSYETMVDDLALAVKALRPQSGPFFLFGHSMGGGLLAHYAARPNIPADGLIFSSAALALADPPDFLLRQISRLAARLLPRGPVPKIFYNLDAKAISRLPEEVRKYDTDPLVYRGPILNRTAWEMVRLVEEITPRFELIRLPHLILHGEADRLTSVEGSQELARESGAKESLLKTYENGYHELFNDSCRQEVTADLLAWLDVRSSK